MRRPLLNEQLVRQRHKAELAFHQGIASCTASGYGIQYGNMALHLGTASDYYFKALHLATASWHRNRIGIENPLVVPSSKYGILVLERGAD